MFDQLQAVKKANQKKEEDDNPSGKDVNLSNVNTNPKAVKKANQKKEEDDNPSGKDVNLSNVNTNPKRMSKHKIDPKTKEQFKETVKFNQDNRYEVCLPWVDVSSPLLDNFNLAKKRLEVTTEKLLSRTLYDKYEKGHNFQEWLD
ncbi:hypothetical protein AVEN_216757-1 [Araneus ventricosus]|uniref:Uncharacterized protein n=1 Tax=Araneus ventricosus TaxID=182803 RepID=A0A4Y2VF83_ARAVE|nr:hypothetical protein AVEN_66078-1 [Araneus ventricosus]GBO23959.1 hypothetical protein AVEN_79864-1 [Araneus ventricosus]GBO23964.1 hypothetical protein AVEN_89394-1 [Araneus ventricosus]GBO23968.1 hypothetical protein AVEN_216757-1 [Araneus ventricosus]